MMFFFCIASEGVVLDILSVLDELVVAYIYIYTVCLCIYKLAAHI